MKKKVIVLMSTYNGERHLVEQIESILNQEGVDVRLMIRDDGSNDKTVEIARKYTDDVVIGENIGYRYSFLELIKNAPEADYYALADQDDIWLPEKLKSAVNMICAENRPDTPILYACSRKNLRDGLLFEAKEVRDYKQFRFNAYNNGYHLQGCTMVFNNRLKQMISFFIPTNLITSHDVWIHQVCKAINGLIIYDKRPFLYYRIENNVIGVPAHRQLNRIKELFKKHKDSDVINLCENLLLGYETHMPKENITICKLLINYRKQKYKVLFRRSLYQGDFIHNLYLFFMLLFDAA